MQTMPLLAFFAVLPLLTSADVVDQAPIQKVVKMLQHTQTKVTAEAEKEKEVYAKFIYFCNTSGSDLSARIAAADSAASLLVSEIEESTAKKSQLKANLKADAASVSEAKEAMAKAAIRMKEAATFAKDSTDYRTNIAALKRAIISISSGISPALLQTKTLAIIRKLATDGHVNNDIDRQKIMALLFTNHSSDYVPRSGEIVGILKQLSDDMSQSLAEITTDEESALTSYKRQDPTQAKKLAPTKKKPKASTKGGVCGKKKYKGDGYCDDDNNNAGCDWDGGDCCAVSAKNGVVSTSYCTECKCLDPSPKAPPQAPVCWKSIYKGDGNCDDKNNNAGCDWDGGDCCEKTAKNGVVQKNYCTDCKCLDPQALTDGGVCWKPHYKGDGNCDDKNNNAGCDWDGGDCCAVSAKNGVVGTSYCTECKCLDPSPKAPPQAPVCAQPQYKGDGNCDDGNNNAGCDWDGGDCCASTMGRPVTKEYCHDCKCLDPQAIAQGGSCGQPLYKGDGYCNDDNNNVNCAFDGGDCCAGSAPGGSVQNDFCKECKCLDPKFAASSLLLAQTQEALVEKASGSEEVLMAAKEKEIATLKMQIEKNNELVGSLAAEIEMKKKDLDEKRAALLKDKEFLTNLDANCDSKKKEWAEIEQKRKEPRTGEVESSKSAKAILSGADFSFLQAQAAGSQKVLRR